ncbi:hypothetical protein AURDEDRAFT_177931 [Auricularia subglabra TFB-10046 SS5]|uniref:Uncharacterized protein n=1 Tax=Auricularia subglabra (strain TFB-10046 / SS5) TaxID=717982 RepID=J0WL11_AURST|nr:hypothetical protein AURDEDRAFT_177931 [Auricularia subglabra TFB-10046 SS5]
MAAYRLADETLSAFLADSLAVPETSFASTTSSPFANIARSSSTILLVCKRWLRVATPLLYETVIIRTAAQSSALAAVLKKHPEFGRHVRKVRVEGGVGASICKLFKAAPHITDLCLTLDLYASDNAAHMYKFLSASVAPRRLVLCSRMNALNRNKLMTAAINGLVTCLSQWTSLRVVTVADVVLKERRIYQAICTAKQLQIISIPQKSSYYYATQGMELSSLAADCAAPVILVGWLADGFDSMLRPRDRRAELSLLAQEKVVFADPAPFRHEPVIAPPPSLSYTPLANVRESTRRKIWTRIFEAVITHTDGIDVYRARKLLAEKGGQGYDDGDGRCDDDSPSDPISKLPRGPVGQCMSVCKEGKEIMAPLACRDLHFLTQEQAVSFIKWIARRSDALDLVAAVRAISFHIVCTEAVRLADLCGTSFLSRFDNLEVFHGANVFLSPTALRTLPTAHLWCLTINSDCGRFEVPSFPALRTLHWTLSRLRAVVEASAMDPSPSMPALETLVVAGDGAPKILLGLSNFNLPGLTSLTFNDKVSHHDSALRSFCAVHGASIRRVFNRGSSDMLSTLLSTCPGLTNVSVCHVPSSSLVDSLRRHPIPHASLEEITYCPISIRERYTRYKAQELEMLFLNEFCNALDPAKFPALRTVHIPTDDFWPHAQRDIAKHPLPFLAEKMLEKGVRIVDASGVGWKHRLTRGERKPNP